VLKQALAEGNHERMNNGNPFFDHPILNSPYGCPERHWELDLLIPMDHPQAL
jgi:hypothetical protein